MNLQPTSDKLTNEAAQHGSPQNRLQYIDGLRGVASGMVMLRHLYLRNYSAGTSHWLDFMGLGYLGVHLFLLLSGFCVAWAYVGGRQRPFALREFVARRATRILPTYYVALLVFTLFALRYRPSFIPNLNFQIATHLTMTHNLFRLSTLKVNGVFWSLALESQLYVLFPFFLASFRRKGAVVTLASIFVLQIAYRIWVAAHFGTGWKDAETIPWAVVGRMGEFALGMFVAILVGRSADKPLMDQCQRLCPPFMLACFAAGAVSYRRLGPTAPFTDLAFTFGFCGLLLWANAPHSRMRAILSLKPLVGLGVFSYSVYLVHVLPMSFASWLLQPYLGPTAIFLVGGGPILAFSIAGGYVFYRLVEKPAMDYFSRRRRRFSA